MNSQREAFEKVFPVPYNTAWNGHRYVTKSDLADDEYAITQQIRWEGWQAATEQGVGEAVAWHRLVVGVGYIFTYQTEKPNDGLSFDQYDWEPLYTHQPKPTGGGVPKGWSFKKQGDSILVQYHENGGFVKGRWIDKQSERFSFEFFDALLATQQPPEQDADK